MEGIEEFIEIPPLENEDPLPEASPPPGSPLEEAALEEDDIKPDINHLLPLSPIAQEEAPIHALDGPTKFSNGSTDIYVRPDHPAHFPTGTTEVLTFYPTAEEFKDFNGYIRKIEASGAHGKCGICKVVPPEGWSPRPSKSNFDDVDDYIILSPVKETTTRHLNGVYRKYNEIYKKQMTVKEFRDLAESKKYRTPKYIAAMSSKDFEKYIWEHIEEREPIYGADTGGSIYDKGIEEFNMNKLGTVLDDYKKVGIVKGVNTVYLYFGMFKTNFPWHSEDMDLYSINYVHFGAPKYWWGIPACSADRFEKLLDQCYPDWRVQCKAFPRHKLCLISPELLRTHNIPFGTMIQRPNEFIITFPRGYHMGFNMGYNCAESTNFATDRWIDYGKNVVICTCKESVTLNMERFMKKYRRDELEHWQKYWFGNFKYKYIETIPYPRTPDAPKKRRGKADEDLGKVLKRKRGNWLKTQNHLNVRTAPDFFTEKQENETQGRYWPHCDVCRLFWPRSHWEKMPDGSKFPNKTQRLVGAGMFLKGGISSGLLDPREERLITCQNCLVTVHPSCYGGYFPKEEDASWKCFRCRDRNDSAIRSTCCNLCEMRSGAFLPCEVGIDTGYVHVTCAIMNRRTNFDRDVGPTFCRTFPSICHQPQNSILGFLNCAYLNAESDFTESSRWSCEICHVLQGGLIQCALCAESLPLREITLAHTTCARQAGFFFEERSFPQNTAMICDRHIFNTYDEHRVQYKKHTAVHVQLNKGDKHLAAVICDVERPNSLAVHFLDGTYSNEIVEKDVIACSCPPEKCDKFYHAEGARLKVYTAEGEKECYYRKSFVYNKYSCRLTETKTVCAGLERRQLFGPNDYLPIGVRRKLPELEPPLPYLP